MRSSHSLLRLGAALLALSLHGLGCSGSESSAPGAGGSAPTACSPEGAVEYCYPGPPTARGVGECTDGTHDCVAGTWSECEGYRLPVDEICDDFLDNNCNGVGDEGCTCETGTVRPCYTGPATTRGVGRCADGTQSCVASIWESECSGQVLPAADEPCNQADDDCNGVVDDGCSCTEGTTLPCYGGPPATRGVGECRDGAQSCVAGAWSTECTGQVVPGAEICNGEDDDCDGTDDDGFGSTSCGLGPCAHSVQSCVDGTPQECDPYEGATAETCDGQDNDCDGVVDNGCSCVNGTTQPCYTGPGGTENHPPCHGGTQTCSNGSWGGCSGQVTPTGEICDDVDNDCNGVEDDGLGSTSCGVGPCAHSQPNCVDGDPQSCNPFLGATSEVCDNVDNNCNGVTDDGNPGGGASCNTGQQGVCAAGTIYCQSGSYNCLRNQEPYAEVCDGLDNNCAGGVDENPWTLCDESNGWYCYGTSGCVWNGTCPFLYTWDGTEFGFEADLYGSGKLGVENSTGWVSPHPDDYHILFHEPAELDGALELRLVEERSEVNYFDQVELVAAYLPEGLGLYTELHAVGSPYASLEESLHTVGPVTQAPLEATHLNTAASILGEIAASDDFYAVLGEDRNLFDYHTVELDLGDLSGAERIKLLIDGRTAFSNSPEGKERRKLFGARTKLEVQDADGAWVAVPSTVATLYPPKEVRRPFVLDLTNAFLANSYRVRLTFLYKTYLDAITIDTTADVLPTFADATLVDADLDFYGHSERVGNELFVLVYGAIDQEHRPAFPGAYTRYGDVTSLLELGDDKHVIYWSGDEIRLRFAPAPPPDEGSQRFYLLKAKGYYKDVTYTGPQTVEPLPFAAMSTYPYDPLVEHYPDDADHTAYRQSYNTRMLE